MVQRRNRYSKLPNQPIGNECGCVRYRIGPFEVESVLLEHAAVLE